MGFVIINVERGIVSRFYDAKIIFFLCSLRFETLFRQNIVPAK